jgi:autotransporter-associated beta strand protein
MSVAPTTISIRRGLIAFDVADGLPADSTITGVVLTVDDVRGLNGNQPVSLYPMYRAWGQGTSFFDGGQGAPATNGDATWYYTFYNAGNPSASPTWSAPGGQPGVDYSASASATAVISSGNANQIFSWSSSANPQMLADVQQWLDMPASDFGWIMLGDESAGQTAKRFGGQNAMAPETPPQLTLQYAPTWFWTGSAGDNAWTTSGNWTAAAGSPSNGAAIVLGDSHTNSGTVDLLSAAPSVSHLMFGPNHPVTITSSAHGGGLLTLNNGAFPMTIVVSGSSQAIDKAVAIVLDSDAWITSGLSSDSLSIASDISSGNAAHGIVKDGPGTLILSGDNTYTGETSVNAGTLILTSTSALPDGTSLTVGAAATSIFAPSLVLSPAGSLLVSAPGDVTAVPEAGTLAYLVAAGLFVIIPARRILTLARSASKGLAIRSQDGNDLFSCRGSALAAWRRKANRDQWPF